MQFDSETLLSCVLSNQKVVKAVLFDIDGTLIDSVSLHAQAWKDAFEHFGYDFSLEKIQSQIGKGGDQLLPVFLKQEEIQEKGKEIERYRGDLFKEKYLGKVRPFPGVRELFKKVLSDGKKVAVASSAKGEELKQYERIAGIEDLLHAETSSADADKSKPHPDIFEAALEKLGDDIPPREVMVIGDSPYDAEAATKAGMKCIGVLSGGFAEADLRKAGYVAIYEDVEELLRNYEDSPLAIAR